MNPQLYLMLEEAFKAYQLGHLTKSEKILKRFLHIVPTNFDAINLLAIVFANQNKYPEAIKHYKKALELDPNDSAILSNLGSSLNSIGANHDALIALKKALKINPNIPEYWYNAGNILCDLEKSEESLIYYEQSVKLKPEYYQAHNNFGRALFDLKRYEESLIYFNKTLNINPHFPECLINKGEALRELKRYDEAIACYDKAYRLRPGYAEAHYNKANTLYQLKRYDEAIACYDKALSLKPDYAEAWSNKGATLCELKRYDEAIACYDKALILQPAIDWVYGDLIHTMMKMGIWLNFNKHHENITIKISENKRVITPLPLLALTDNAILHKKSSEIYAEDKYPPNLLLGLIPKHPQGRKIRIAYFSADFRSHPVAYLTSELFEIHDRTQFEVYAFSLQKTFDDAMNIRLRKGFDRFMDVENISGIEIAQVARDLKIDIAIDLTGPTQYSRAEIFSYRAAPIQVNWLGYPGTAGAKHIDYIVADDIIIPESHRQFYTEKVAYLPDTYMVDDSKRIASSRVFTREECGLPENAFVFCCFNNNYKFNPRMLDRWSRILLQAENSVLWISENNQHFKANLTAELEMRGIDSNRIIFAQRLELMADHLARYSIANLFLDTHPYNAHTTAIDSLKAGVPVLTLRGHSFASRVAASLLSAIGLTELITDTEEQYEALAVQLANIPEKLDQIRKKLESNRLTTPLFDTPLFAKNIEAAYIKMYDRYQKDLQPDHIF